MKVGGPPPTDRVVNESVLSSRVSSSDPKNSDSLLPQGRLIKGTVLSFAPDGQVQLSVSGKMVTAESLVPLKIGQDLWFEVVREGTQPLLALAGRKVAAVSLLRLLSSSDFGRTLLLGVESAAAKLSDPLGVGAKTWPSSIEQFMKLFPESIMGSDADPAKIIKIVLALNVFDKRQIEPGAGRSAKQELRDYIHALSQGGGADVSGDLEESKGVVRLLKLFEACGHLNSPVVGPEQQNFLLFPCFFSGASGWGEWLLNLGPEKDANGSSGQTYGLSFFLELSNLGELHLQVHLQGTAFQGVFSVADENVSKHISENLEELSLVLQNLDFHPVRLSCQATHSGNLQALKEELGEKVGAKTFALVDVTI